MKKNIKSIICTLLFLVLFILAVLDMQVEAYASEHAHFYKYIPDGAGNHTVTCINGCGYSRTEGCDYMGEGNVRRCKYCGYVEPLYLFKDDKSCMVYLSNGDRV